MALTPASDDKNRAKMLEDRQANPLNWGVGRSLEQEEESKMIQENQPKKGK